eukprot:gene7316-11635_t
MKYELNVHIIDARDVPGMDLNGKSDLFVEIKVDQKFKRTKTIKKTNFPIWDEMFILPFDGFNQNCQIALYDWDSISNNDLIGKLQVPIGQLLPGKNDLFLKMEVKGKTVFVHTVMFVHPVLQVALCEGKDLPAMDLNGKADPFALLKVGKKEFKSKTIKKTLNPNWNENFEWKLDAHLDELLYVSVFDWDMLSSNDLIGRCVVTMSSLKCGTNDLWLSLERGGMVHLKITCIGFGLR